jgi:hypothetical protein
MPKLAIPKFGSKKLIKDEAWHSQQLHTWHPCQQLGEDEARGPQLGLTTRILLIPVGQGNSRRLSLWPTGID